MSPKTSFPARAARGTDTEKLSRVPAVAMLGVAFLLVAVIGYLAFASGRSHDLAAKQAAVSRRIQGTASEILSLLKDAETGQRGFLITGRESYLEPYNKAVAELPGLFKRFEEPSSERPGHADRARFLRPVVESKLRELKRTIGLRRSEGFDGARELVDTDEGQQLMDDIRARCQSIGDLAETRIRVFGALEESSVARLRLVSLIGSVVLLGFIVLLAVTVLRSLDHREHLYREAASNAEHLRVTLNSIGDAVIATDAVQHITFINPVASNLTGWEAGTALGLHVSEVVRIVNETSRLPVANPLAEAILTGTVVGLANHTILLAKDGRETAIDDSASPIRDGKGRLDGAILVFRDISERREAERQLRTSHDQLKNFVDAAAHDLRAPLRTVSAFSQLLNDQYRSEPGEWQEYLRFIRQGTERMGRLLEDLLSYANAGHFETDDEPGAGLRGAFVSALENLSADIQAAGAVVTADDTLPVLPVHDSHLMQLLQNLIGNAIKYRGSEPPRIHVSCAETEAGWVVQVKDNGIGVDPRFREVIFQPFKRLHGEDLPGSGIGLATCQKIVAGYGGNIRLESAPGQGSVFSFTIPLVKSTQAAG
jgi:PAS domain S-box-containing protein